VLLAVGLSGCNEKSTDGLGKSNEEKILGTWGGVASGDEETSIFNFFSNGTFFISAMVLDFWSNSNIRQTIWGTYVMTDETLAMEVKGDTNALEYSFSDNGKKLTLIAVEQGGQFAVLTKYDSPPPVPSIQFMKNDENYTLAVSAIDPSDVIWSNIEITGTCDTSSLGTYVRIGDMITGCSGTITIRDTPTNILLGTWTFTATTPHIQFYKDIDSLTITTADPNNILWSNIEITGTCDASSLGTYVAAGDMITSCSGTITIRDIPSNHLLGTWDFA